VLITADWIVPISRPPIPFGGLVVHGGHVLAIGPADELGRLHPTEPVHALQNCTLLPGLVNAHTHMALTCLKGLLGPMPFHEWIARIPRAFAALGPDDIAASISLGALRSIACGVTAIGDIAYGPESVAIAADAGLGGAFFWEVLGIRPDAIAERLEEIEFPSDPARAAGDRLRYGLSPHAPYTSGPELLRALHVHAVAQEAGWAVHVSESPAETELLAKGGGPLAPLAARLARGFAAPHSGTIAYLDSLGVLDRAVAVHLTQSGAEDLAPLAARAAGAVLCPRSNAYLRNGAPPVWRLREAGVRLALGTDSLASNHDLDLWEEARALHRLEQRLSAEDLVRMLTLGGAEVLGLAPQFGTLDPGSQADFAAYRAPASANPYANLLGHAGRSSVDAVMSAGVWRMINGLPTFGTSVIERAAYLGRQKAALALGVDPERTA
jgi:5-methylthioadenosine/S-adenosylhomocysteine deaminase